MTRAVRVGYGILAALLGAAFFVLLLTLVFDLDPIGALALLAVLDLVIIVGGWRIAKRAAVADQRDPNT